MGFLDDVTDSIGLTNHAGQKAAKGQQKNLAALFGKLGQQQAGMFGMASSQLMKALQSQQKGYGNALANSGLAGSQSKRSVLDREKQAQGGAAQSLANRGLYNTTLLDNARRGITSATNKDLSQIDAMVSQIQSQLQTGLANAQANTYGNLAGLYQNQANSQTQLGLAEGQQRFGGEPFAFNSSGLAPGGIGQLTELASFFL